MANNVRIRRKQLGLTLEEVANEIGTTKATIMKLEKGVMQLTEVWLRKLSKPLQCLPEDLIAENAMLRNVPLIGEVQEKGRLILYKPLPTAGAGEISADAEYWRDMDYVDRPPNCGSGAIYAVRLSSESFEPFLPKGSIVYYGEAVDSIDELLGRLVVCETEDGALWVRQLQRGNSFDSYDLYGANAAPVKDVTVKWCAKIIFMKPA